MQPRAALLPKGGCTAVLEPSASELMLKILLYSLAN